MIIIGGADNDNSHAVKQGRVFTSIDGVKQKVIDHGYHYKKRYIKTEESKEKLYIHDDIEFQIL